MGSDWGQDQSTTVRGQAGISPPPNQPQTESGREMPDEANGGRLEGGGSVVNGSRSAENTKTTKEQFMSCYLSPQ